MSGNQSLWGRDRLLCLRTSLSYSNEQVLSKVLTEIPWELPLESCRVEEPKWVADD